MLGLLNVQNHFSKKCTAHTLIINTLLLKNAIHHLSLKQDLIFLLVVKLTSMLAVDWSGWWWEAIHKEMEKQVFGKQMFVSAL